MAGAPDESDREKEKFPNFSDLDDTVSHILYGVANEGKGKVAESLLVDIERDLMVQSRECLFKHAVERYKEELRSVNIQESPDLYAKRRTGEKATISLSNDIVDLYVYAGNLVDTFPKAILGNAGKYIEFKRPTAQKTTGELDSVGIQRRLAEMASKLSEQCEQVKTMQKDIESIKESYEKRIKSLEVELGKAKKAVQDIAEMCRPADKKTSDNARTEQVKTRDTNVSVSADTNPHVQGQQLVVKLPELPVSKSCAELTMDIVNDQRKQQKQQSAANPVNTTNGNTCVQTSHKGAPNSSSDTPRQLPVSGQTHTGAPPERPAAMVAHSANSLVEYPVLGSCASPDVLKSYTAAERDGQQWTKVTYAKSRRSPGKQETPLRGANRASPSSPRLRGVKHEKTVTIYAKNIAREDMENDDAVKAKVRKYVKKKRDVRIVSIQVVRNKFCDDTVGCKLCIPANAMDYLLAPGFWPDDVQCREWSRRPPNGRGQRSQRGRQDRRDTRDYSDVDNGERGYATDELSFEFDKQLYDEQHNEWAFGMLDHEHGCEPRDCREEDGDVREHRVDYHEEN